MDINLDPQLRRVLEKLSKEDLPVVGDSDEEIEAKYPGILRATDMGLVKQFKRSSIEDWWWYEINADGRMAIGLPPEREPKPLVIPSRILDKLPTWFVTFLEKYFGPVQRA